MQKQGNKTQIIRKLKYLTSASAVSNALNLFSLLMLTKAMGPEHFGSYYVYISLVSISIIPITIGLGAALVQQLSSSVYGTEVNFGSTFVAASILSAVVAVCFITYVSLDGGKHRFWDTSDSLAIFLFSIILIHWSMFESYLRGLRKIQALSALKIVGAFVNLSISIGIVNFGHVEVSSPLVARSAEMVTIIVGSIILLPMKLHFCAKSLRSHLRFAAPISLSIIGLTLFSNIDKFMLKEYSDRNQLGVYSLMFFLTYVLLSKLGDVIHAVLFAEAVAFENKMQVAKKLLKLWVVGYAAVFCAIFVSVLVVLQFMGPGFDADWWEVVVFAFGSVAFFVAHIFWWLISSSGSQGASLFSRYALLSSLIAIAIYVGGIPKLGQTGALIGLTIGSVMLFGSSLYYISLMSNGRLK